MSVVLSHPGARMAEKIDVLPPREYLSSSSSVSAASAKATTICGRGNAKSMSMGSSTKSMHKSVSVGPVEPADLFQDANDENSSSKSNQVAHVSDAVAPRSTQAMNEKQQSTVDDTSSSATASCDSDSPRAKDARDATALPADDSTDEFNNNDLSEDDVVDLLTQNDTVVVNEKKDTARSHAGRFSESAVPEKMDPDFVLPVRPQDYTSTRSSLVSFEPSAKANDGANGFNNNRRGGNFVDFSMRDSLASDGGFDAFHFLNMEEGESSLASNSIVTPRSMMRTNPYEGISIDVNNHSINNKGVVMYHVDIKGPEGLLSTYTIRRRYRAFKDLHQELQRLISEYAATQTQENAQAQASADFVSDAFSADNVPDSPHTQARNHQKLQQIAENSVLSASFTFPALPNGGVWSYLKRHDVRLVEQRKKRFEEILRIAIRHPATKCSPMLDSFLSVAPNLISQRGSSYVSLQDYSVPVFDRQRESIERKQLKKRLIEGRRQRTSSEASSSQS
jgi:hypothetical protein